jgi:hypothetical protein
MFHNVKPIATTYHIYHQVSLISVAGTLGVAPSLADIYRDYELSAGNNRSSGF